MHGRSKNRAAKNGFTLLETLIVLFIISLVALFGAPSFLESLRQYQLKSALQETYFLLKAARRMSIHLGKDITVNFDAQKEWCIALNDNGQCDCHTKNACSVLGQPYLLNRQGFPNVALDTLLMGNINALVFDRNHGISVGRGGSGQFSTPNAAGKFIVSNLGRVRICVSKGKIGGYSPC